MATLFIADLHLNAQQPAITAGFLRFLQQQASQAEALYILGDLFEVWIGDDDLQPLHQQVAAALYRLQQSGVPCYFIQGNRDFLLGKTFARASGLTLLPAEQLIDIAGRQAVILHGDTLCTDDHAYQRFRRIVHNPFIQAIFLALPLGFRHRIAQKMRRRSENTNQEKVSDIMDVNDNAVLACLRRHRVTLMIHGHTHRPAIHTIDMTAGDMPAGEAQRAVLGAWHQQGSMIRVTPEAVELISFPF